MRAAVARDTRGFRERLLPYAIRGALVNATVYDDRLEIVSSDLLASGLSSENRSRRTITCSRIRGSLRMTERTSSAG